MNKPARTRLSKRRVVPRLLLAAGMICLLVLLAGIGWQQFLERAGGEFKYAPEDAHWVLSPAARTLVAHAFDGLVDVPITDYQVAVISQGQLARNAIDNNSYYRRSNGNDAGPLTRIGTRLRLAAAGVQHAENIDGRYASRLARQIRAMPGDYRIHLLARDWRYSDDGRRDTADTYTYIANAYVGWLAQRLPAITLPVVSIHPYRADALTTLKQWAEQGVGSVAWWPLRQNIDLADPRALAMYKIMVEHHMTLQLPVGAVSSTYISGNHWIDPDALRAPLQMGVTVAVRIWPGQSPHKGTPVVNKLVRLAREFDNGQLQITLAGLLSGGNADRALLTLLQHPDLYDHLRYASGYPQAAVNMHIDLDALARAGFIRAADIAPLREVYHINPMLFIFVLWRNVRLPGTSLQLPTSVFAPQPQ